MSERAETIEDLFAERARFEARIAALEARSNQLQLAIDTAQIATWNHDLITDRITYGGHHEKLFGVSPEATGDTPEAFLRWVHPDDRERLLEAVRRSVVSDDPYTIEFRVNRPDGALRWFHGRGTVYRNQRGEPVRITGVGQDITERKLAEIGLRESEERYRSLFAAGPQPMLVFDVETFRFLAVNDATVKHYGFTREEFLEMTVFDLHPPEDLPKLNHHLQNLPAPGWIGNWKHRKKDGSVIDVEIRGHFIQMNQRRVRFVMAHDITERRQTEEALRASEAKYRSLIENLDLPIFLKDLQLRYVAANKPFCDAKGLPEPDIIGKTDFEISPRTMADKYTQDDRSVLTTGARLELEEESIVEGKPRLVRTVKTPVKDGAGHTVGVLGIFWDVTEQRNLEAQLRQAQKMEAIGMLAGGVAHDFNNLLAVIVGNIALTLGGLPENHPNRDLLMTAEHAGVQASELTNRLLGFARQTILRTVPTKLTTCMEETVRIVRRTFDPRIELDVKTTPDLWAVTADPGQINQVLLNLCLNARDAMAEGGRVVLEAGNVVVGGDYVRQRVEARTGEFVRLSIVDTGHGISEETRARIFEPFFTTKAPGKGTGLGLSMVFGIVKQHEGWIECQSVVGKGTRFDVYLPRLAEDNIPPPSPRILKPAQPKGGHETILLADDEPMIRKLGRTILERYGYRVLLAEDGLEAIQIYEQEKGAIDLVILDLTMPRLSGHDALQHLLQLDPQVQVLFASGYSAEHLNQTYHEQAAGFISKPFRPEQLAQAIREVLDRPESAGVGIENRRPTAKSQARKPDL